MTTDALIRQLAAALRAQRTKRGHFPGCGHRQWLNGYNIVIRHECQIEGCDGEGQPCSQRCQAANAALAAAERGLAEQAGEGVA